MKMLLLPVLFVCSTVSFASTSSKNIFVSATVISSCSLNSVNPSFDSSKTSKILPGEIDIHCDKGTDYTVSMSSSKNSNNINNETNENTTLSYHLYNDSLYHENITNKTLNSHGICNNTNIATCDTKIQSVEYKAYPKLSKNLTDSLTKLPSDEVLVTVSY